MNLRIKPFRDYAVGSGYSLSCADGAEAATGRVTLLTGDSGSGKSVFLQVLAGLRSTQCIEAEVRLRPGAEAIPFETFVIEETRRSYLPQASVLHDYLTPERALDAWCDVLASTCLQRSGEGVSVHARKEDLVERLFSAQERAQLFAPHRAPRIRQLSGGQKRRLDVVMALSSPAEIVLLDEPDSGLDASRRHRLLETLHEVAASQNKIIILVSHFAEAEATAEDLDVWQIHRHADGHGANLETVRAAPAVNQELKVHQASDERGDLRLDHFLIYFQRRLWSLPTGRGLATILTPFFLIALIRLAIYPSEAVDTPSMALLYFFAVTCFWLGTVQTTSFWADEWVFFQRECRQGASSLAFVASFLGFAILIGIAQASAAALATRYINWAGLLSTGPAPAHSDLNLGFWRLVAWGSWASVNGIVIGLFWSTVQDRWRPRLTGTATSQILALCITLCAIVFSFPIIGQRAYNEVTGNPHSPDRSEIIADAVRSLSRTETPALAILAAELPIGMTPSFHGLWFQAERPLRYRLPAATQDNMQKYGVPEGAWNASILGILVLIILTLTYRAKRRPIKL